MEIEPDLARLNRFVDRVSRQGAGKELPSGTDGVVLDKHFARQRGKAGI